MLVKNVGNLSASLAESHLSRSKLWHRDTSKLTPLDLLAFVRGHNYAYEAQRNVERLIGETIKEVARGELRDVGYLGYSPREATFTSGELASMLSTLSYTRRRAILFGIEMDMAVKDVVCLTWRLARRLPLTTLAHDILECSARHIKLNYVFWEYMENGATAPLFGLEETALDASYGLGYESLRRLYKRITWVDEDSEVQSFQEALRDSTIKT